MDDGVGIAGKRKPLYIISVQLEVNLAECLAVLARESDKESGSRQITNIE